MNTVITIRRPMKRDVVTIHSGASRIRVTPADAKQIAYALLSLAAGQGPSLIEVSNGKRERKDV